MNKILLLILTLTLSLGVSAQKNKKKEKEKEKIKVEAPPTLAAKQKRIELKLNKSNDNFHIITLDSEGLAVVYMNEDKDYMLAKYGTDLKKEYSQVLKIEGGSNNLAILNYGYSENDIYILFADISPSSTYRTMREYTILRYDLESKKQDVINGQTAKPFLYSKMAVDNGLVFLFGTDNIPNSQASLRVCATFCLLGIPAIFGSLKFPTNPAMEVISFKNKNNTHEIADYGKKAQAVLLSGDVNESSNEGYLLIKHRITKKESRLYLRNFKYDGGNIKTNPDVEIKGDITKEFRNAKVNVLNADEKLMFGTYGKPTPMGTNHYTYSEGIYFCKLNGKKQVFTKFIPYVDIKKIKASMSSYDKKQMDKSKAKGKDYSIAKQILFHDVVEDENGYLLIGETYYATYHTEEKMVYNPGTKRWEKTTTVIFDGYLYENCLVMSFDKEGKLLWDDAFELPYFLTFNPTTELVTIAPNGDKLGFTYFYNGRIRTRSLETEGVSEIEGNAKIESKKKSDKVNNRTTNVRYWFGTTYVVFGHADITNKDKRSGEKTTKRVLYINKMDMADTVDEDEEETDEDDE
jgi:hypothetical protein